VAKLTIKQQLKAFNLKHGSAGKEYREATIELIEKGLMYYNPLLDAFRLTEEGELEMNKLGKHIN
jgi:hypothetical protein